MRVVSSSSAALVLALMASASSSTQAKTLSEYENEFAHWMAQHGHSFANNALEYARRLETYITNDLFINRHNAENKYSFTLGHNAYSHLTFDEFKQRYMGLRLAPGYVEQRLAQKPNGLLKHVDAPVSMDWVDKGGVTPVKNQGMCGSCWAFSTTGAVEGAAYVASGQLFSLSEQELVDCDDNGDMGCNGGLMDHAFQWIESHNGLCREEDYPYTAKQGVCKTTCEPVVKVTGYQDVDPNDESQLKAAVAQQPVSVAIEADQKEFQFYKSGVFDKKCGTQLDHGVLAVGYGAENGAKFWKVKNSWGDKWGENGYIRMSREAGSAHGQCGIAMVPSYPFASVIKHDTVARNTTMASAKSVVAGAMASVGSSAKITQCGDKTKSLVVFDDLEIAPTAPKRGKPVTFFGSGDIKKGFDTAVFQLDVRLAGERVFHHKGKICGDTHVPLPLGLGHIDVHGFQCPVAVGKFSDLKVDVNLPKIAPAGDYEIQFTSGDSTAAIDDLFCVHVDLDLTNHHTEEEKSKVYEPLMAVM